MTELGRLLDLDALAAFVLVADLMSFTRAAEAQGTTQSTTSLKIKRLEASLGRRLLERTPRSVRLAPGCDAFLLAARDLLARHGQLLATLEGREVAQLKIGISDQAAGRDLPAALSLVAKADPDLLLDVRVGFSRDLLDRYDRGEVDAVVVRSDDDRRHGEILSEEPYCWMAAPSWQRPLDRPLPLATLAEPCNVRSLAVRTLERAGITWRDAFIGSGVAAVSAAISAGLAVSVLAPRVAPIGVIDVGPKFSLPPLPSSSVVLLSRVSGRRFSAALRLLAAGFRAGAASHRRDATD